MPDPGQGFPANYADIAAAAGRIRWSEATAASNASNATANVKIPVTMPNGTTLYLFADAENF